MKDNPSKMIKIKPFDNPQKTIKIFTEAHQNIESIKKTKNTVTFHFKRENRGRVITEVRHDPVPIDSSQNVVHAHNAHLVLDFAFASKEYLLITPKE